MQNVDADLSQAKSKKINKKINKFIYISQLWIVKESLFLLFQEAVVPKFLDLGNLNFQGLCELISLLVQQNLGCFLTHTYVVYSLEHALN